MEITKDQNKTERKNTTKQPFYYLQKIVQLKRLQRNDIKIGEKNAIPINPYFLILNKKFIFLRENLLFLKLV